jgi:hypothetical protein
MKAELVTTGTYSLEDGKGFWVFAALYSFIMTGPLIRL